MKVKSYYAKSVEEAVDRAGGELGPDAMLVQSRKSPLELRHLGPYEVIFALPGKKQRPVDTAQNVDDAPAGPSESAVSIELMQVRRQMEEIRRTLATMNVDVAQGESESVPCQAQRMLLAAGIDEEVALPLAHAAAAARGKRRSSRARQSGEDGHDEALRRALRTELAQRIVSSPGVRARGEEAGAVAFIGPPAAGKTTALVKLAALLGQDAERPVHIVSADGFRIGAADQMRTYASIMGVSVDFTDRPAAISQILAANSHKQIILIDTPGLSGGDFEMLDGLAAFLAGRKDIEKHLVLPATWRPRDLKRCLRNYERFRPDKLLFTHLDDTDLFGAIYSAAAWSGLPISFFCAGQQIPDDLESASAAKLVDLLFGAEKESKESKESAHACA